MKESEGMMISDTVVCGMDNYLIEKEHSYRLKRYTDKLRIVEKGKSKSDLQKSQNNLEINGAIVRLIRQN